MKKILLLTILSVNICLPMHPLDCMAKFCKFQFKTTCKVTKASAIVAYNIIELGAAYHRGANFNWGLGDY